MVTVELDSYKDLTTGNDVGYVYLTEDDYSSIRFFSETIFI